MLRGQADKRKEGSYAVGRVVALRLRNRQPVCDVDVGGSVYRDCRFVVLGGGKGAFRYHPPVAPTDAESVTPGDSDGAEVLVLFAGGARPHPVVVAAHLNPGSRTRFDTIDPPDGGKDYSDFNDLQDDVVENGQSRMVVSHHGDIVLDSKQSSRPVHVQMAEDGYLRIAQGGDSTERTLLAGPLVNAYNKTVDDVNALRKQVADLSTLVVAAQTAGKAAGAAPPAVAAAVGGAFAAGTVGPYLAQPATSKLGDDVVASAVRLSSRSKAQE